VLQFTVGTGGEGAGSATYTRATPDAIVSFIAYGYLRIGIAGDRISYQFIDQSGRVRDRWNSRSRDSAQGYSPAVSTAATSMRLLAR
jgi:hypothetical protein